MFLAEFTHFDEGDHFHEVVDIRPERLGGVSPSLSLTVAPFSVLS